jgi:hypothetical protein
MRFSQDNIESLLDAWPTLRRLPVSKVKMVSVEGPMSFSMEPPGLPRIDDSYSIRIDIPLGQVGLAPFAYEVGRRIPQMSDNHVNPDGSLCLGSPWTVRRKMGNPASLLRFAEECVVPFLYAATWRELGNQGFPFSELRHGLGGLDDDYAEILGLKGRSRIDAALALLSIRPRLANKCPCPCGCGKRLGKCEYRNHLNKLRVGLPASFFASIRSHMRQTR